MRVLDVLQGSVVVRGCVRVPNDVPMTSVGWMKIPRFIPHTKPTPPDESDTTKQVFLQSRMNPPSPDHSDRFQSPYNPSVAGSIPAGPTN